MASEEDNFDIDIYGDGDNENQGGEDLKDAPEEFSVDEGYGETYTGTNGDPKPEPSKEEAGDKGDDQMDHTEDHASGAGNGQTEERKLSPRQGTKRKEAPDDRPIENGATTAILISDLHWWTTDDDIRGWINQSGCEDELKDVTFHEHKVNGKSKGQAYVEFASLQAASALKRKIESFNESSTFGKKHTIAFSSPMNNPFRTLPKDAPARGKDGPRNQDNRAGSSGFNSPGNPNPPPMNFGPNNFGSFRGGRGGFNNRGGGGGGGGMNTGGFQNRSFSGPMAGGSPGGFQGTPMGGFQGAPMGGMPNFGGFPNRGGMMTGMRGGPGGNRGGRGGMGQTPMMGGMPNMGGMGMGMGMPNMGGMGGNMNMGSMGMQGQGGFQPGPSPHYNPNFFNQNQNQNQAASGDGNWNPHGAKRPRPE
ncbi:MAG: hypothetical protein M4579_003471 [Chaenotheca gracillima]|nr:MAG: hypothetical protein M4579_003471 [Chaenotheca gracillima]